MINSKQLKSAVMRKHQLLFAGVELKLLPFIVIVCPAAPDKGEKEFITGDTHCPCTVAANNMTENTDRNSGFDFITKIFWVSYFVGLFQLGWL